MEKIILDDLFKIYLSSIDSYNSKIWQTINDKYTIIDKSMLAVYLYVKILEDRNERDQFAVDTLTNYILKQIIYGETGNLALEITDKSQLDFYHKVIDELVIEKFAYKNRILARLKYNYQIIKDNPYQELLIFCEKIAELAILDKMVRRGNQEAESYFIEQMKRTIEMPLEKLDVFYSEKSRILQNIQENTFVNTQYGQLLQVVLNLKDVYRYSNLTTTIPENVLAHQYTMAVIGIVFSQYLNQEMGEAIDIYQVIVKSIFHDFGEYKGNEIVTQVKNYNEDTKKMFKMMEEADERDLKEKIGNNLFEIIISAMDGQEGYIIELMDKMIAIMKLWIEVEYMGNQTYIKSVCTIFQSRFKRFKKVEKIDSLKNKEFYLDLVRCCYIYVKEHLMECNEKLFLKYFTKQEQEEIRREIAEIRVDKTKFLE